MTQTYDVLLASGRTVFDTPVGLAHARDGGDIAVSLGVVPLGPHFSIVLRPHPTPAADQPLNRGPPGGLARRHRPRPSTRAAGPAAR